MFDLKAKNEKVPETQFSWFFWRLILEKTGAGYVLGFGFYDDDPGKYVYNEQLGSGSPMSNDGYGVTEFEAECMAACCFGYVHVRRFMEEDNVLLREIERFAKFAERSEGFTIN
jgi:hypothetical protein